MNRRAGAVILTVSCRINGSLKNHNGVCRLCCEAGKILTGRSNILLLPTQEPSLKVAEYQRNTESCPKKKELGLGGKIRQNLDSPDAWKEEQPTFMRSFT